MPKPKIKTVKQPEETTITNTFDKTLREIRAGLVITELSQKLSELVAAVRATGKGGKLRLDLAIKPASKGETVCVMVEDDITVKLPKPERANTIFYSTEDNLLQRNDPRQSEFELKEVPQAQDEPITIAATA